jgi:hypothetical protein
LTGAIPAVVYVVVASLQANCLNSSDCVRSLALCVNGFTLRRHCGGYAVVAFKDGNKWRVHNGLAPFYTTIEDTEFLAKIDAGMRFGKGDLLNVDLRRIQRMVDSRLVSDYRVVKVREHRAPSQRALL